jgi:hypothetical protein
MVDRCGIVWKKPSVQMAINLDGHFREGERRFGLANDFPAIDRGLNLREFFTVGI